MNTMSFNENWYLKLANKHGEKFAIDAGYFHETLPWKRTYTEVLGADLMTAPKGATKIIQFSGAFFPFHEGHLEIIQTAIGYLNAPTMIILHIDHQEYRHSKGSFAEDRFLKALDLIKNLNSKHSVVTRNVFEDKMPDSCSRNFTRLYQEIEMANPNCEVWFLAGGDRASFCLTFIDEGRCLIVGREHTERYQAFYRRRNERIVFLPGNNLTSSTGIREING